MGDQPGYRQHVQQNFDDSRYLAQLEQLRQGKRSDTVSVHRQQVQSDGGVKHQVFYAPDGQFVDQGNGRWIYVDELGGVWGSVKHDRVARYQGRLPYGHLVCTDYPSRQDPQQVAQRAYQAGHLSSPDASVIPHTATEINFVRQPLAQPQLDDFSPRRTGIDGNRLSTQEMADLAAGRPAPTAYEVRQRQQPARPASGQPARSHSGQAPRSQPSQQPTRQRPPGRSKR